MQPELFLEEKRIAKATTFAVLDDECTEGVVWIGGPEGERPAKVSDLTPADPTET